MTVSRRHRQLVKAFSVLKSAFAGGRGSRDGIQVHKTAPLVIIEGHVETMLITVCFSVMRIELHPQYDGMFRNIFYAGIEIFAPVSFQIFMFLYSFSFQICK